MFLSHKTERSGRSYPNLMMGWGRGDDLGGGEKSPLEPRLGGKEEVE